MVEKDRLNVVDWGVNMDIIEFFRLISSSLVEKSLQNANYTCIYIHTIYVYNHVTYLVITATTLQLSQLLGLVLSRELVTHLLAQQIGSLPSQPTTRAISNISQHKSIPICSWQNIQNAKKNSGSPFSATQKCHPQKTHRRWWRQKLKKGRVWVIHQFTEPLVIHQGFSLLHLWHWKSATPCEMWWLIVVNIMLNSG